MTDKPVNSTPVPSDPTKLVPGEQWDATKGALAHAKATGVDMGTVEGTGKGGTVTKADVAAAAAPGAAPTSDPTKLAPGEQWDATAGALAHAEATGVDIGTVEGTGKGGTVTKADVAEAAEPEAAAEAKPQHATARLEEQVAALADNELGLVHQFVQAELLRRADELALRGKRP